MGRVQKFSEIAYQRTKDKDPKIKIQRLDSKESKPKIKIKNQRLGSKKESSKDSVFGSLSLVEDDSTKTQLRERAIAERILRKLGDTKSWKFYLKCAYTLSEERIENILAYATRPNVEDPNRYFVSAAAREMN